MRRILYLWTSIVVWLVLSACAGGASEVATDVDEDGVLRTLNGIYEVTPLIFEDGAEPSHDELRTLEIGNNAFIVPDACIGREVAFDIIEGQLSGVLLPGIPQSCQGDPAQRFAISLGFVQREPAIAASGDTMTLTDGFGTRIEMRKIEEVPETVVESADDVSDIAGTYLVSPLTFGGPPEEFSEELPTVTFFNNGSSHGQKIGFDGCVARNGTFDVANGQIANYFESGEMEAIDCGENLGPTMGRGPVNGFLERNPTVHITGDLMTLSTDRGSKIHLLKVSEFAE